MEQQFTRFATLAQIHPREWDLTAFLEKYRKLVLTVYSNYDRIVAHTTQMDTATWRSVLVSGFENCVKQRT